VSSEPILTVNGVEQASSAEQASVEGVDFVDAHQLDPVDVLRGLAHMDVLRERIAHCRGNRLRDFPPLALTAATRHLREFGHELAHGCCRPYTESEA